MEIQIEEIPEKEFSEGRKGKWNEDKIKDFVSSVLTIGKGRGNINVPLVSKTIGEDDEEITTDVFAECHDGMVKYPAYALMLQIKKLNPDLKMKTHKNKPFETIGSGIRFYGL